MHSKTFTVSKEPAPTTSKVLRLLKRAQPPHPAAASRLAAGLTQMKTELNKFVWHSVSIVRLCREKDKEYLAFPIWLHPVQCLGLIHHYFWWHVRVGGVHRLWKSYAPLLVFLLTTKPSCKQIKKKMKPVKLLGFRFVLNLFGRHLN